MSLMKKNSGFSLLEIMIAVSVLSIGLLGLAKLQGASLKTNQSATLRSQVTMLASDMFDTMRANQVEAESGSYNITKAQNPPTSPTSLSGDDLVNWFNSIAVVLPPGSDASIACADIDATDTLACSPGSLFTINLFWDEFEYSTGDSKKNLQEANFTYSGVL